MEEIVREIKNAITEKGIKLTKVSEHTGIEYQRLSRIFNQNAALLASEFISLCSFLEIDPKSFMNNLSKSAWKGEARWI